MNSAKVLLAVIVVGVISGCTPGPKEGGLPERIRLTVDFQQGQTLKYKFVSSRNISIDWGQMPGAGQARVMTLSESLVHIVSYTPVEVDPYGVTTIQATCELAKVNRTSHSTRQASNNVDAAESFAGKTWTFMVDPKGRMLDRSKLYEVIREAGQKAFRPDRSKGNIKEPEMIYDFIASQWFLWDSISSIKNPTEGVGVGEQWKSLLFVPAPMILFAARDVNYRLDEIRQGEAGRVAVIGSSYILSYPCPPEWPVPYDEVFQMSGMFGFLRGYKVLDLQGGGQELFNIDAGRIESENHKWTVRVSASLLLPGVKPTITIEQTLTTELLEPTRPPEGQAAAPAKK